MKKYLTFIFMVFFLIANGHLKADNINSKDISYIVSPDSFRLIKQFVIDKGQTRTYCNKYSDNPYYEFGGDIRMYLNPIIPFPKRDECTNPNTYNSLTLDLPHTQHYNFRYIDIVEDTKENKIYLYPYYDTKQTLNDKEIYIREIIPHILEEIKK